MRTRLITLLLIVLAPVFALAQIKQAKPKKAAERPTKESIRIEKAKAVQLGIPTDLNKEYQQKFKNLRDILQINFKRNRSGKLQYCSKPDLIPNEWLDGQYHFINQMAELDRFETLLCELNIGYLQQEIDQARQFEILSKTREILRMKDKVIKIADRKGQVVVPRPPLQTISSSLSVDVQFIPVRGKTGIRIDGARVYAINPFHFFNCETCADCLAPDSGCDINTLKGENNYDVTQMAPGTVLDPGSYYIFVTLMDYDVERVIYFENREIGMEDNGKVVRLGVR